MVHARGKSTAVAFRICPRPQPLRPVRPFHAGLCAGRHRTRTFAVRTSPLRPGKWLFTLVAAVCLAIGACYELIEWAAALILGQGADAFLGAQGDPWDAQWDRFLALTGAITAQLLLAGRHDRQLERIRTLG